MKPSSDKLDEANLILEELGLLALLNHYGEAAVVGSVALNLIVKPDLDVHLLIKDKDLMPAAHTILEYLIKQPKIKEVRLTDWREKNGLKIGVDAYPTDFDAWSIDIWITNDRMTTAFDFVRKLNNTLTKNQRETILKIKNYFYEQGLLKDGLSLKIYIAVIEHNVETVEKFLEIAKGEVV